MSVLELFSHPGCFSKRHGLGLIHKVLKRYPDISFKEADLLRYKERAHSLGIKMSPALVLDGKIISVGIPEIEKLEALLKSKKKKIQVVPKSSKGLVLTFAVVFLFATSSFPLTAFDHHYSEWQDVLKRYVQNGLVDYVSIRKSPDLLDAYIESIGTVSHVEYRQWSDHQKIAFWVNAYNAAVLKTVVDHYPLRKRPSWKAFAFPSNSIQQIPNVWNRPALEVFGEKVSLNHIEHEILCKEFKEPRIHFALVCASSGCPILQSEPYLADKLDLQLNDQIAVFLADPKKFRYNLNTNVLYLSPIFKWFKKDFEQVGGVLSFLKVHLPGDAGKSISEKTKIEWLDYDWSLNERK